VSLSRAISSIAHEPVHVSRDALYINRDCIAGCAHDNDVHSFLISKCEVRLKAEAMKNGHHMEF
jgi:hypothetical protein